MANYEMCNTSHATEIIRGKACGSLSLGFGSLVVLDVVFRYLPLCLLYINTKIGKNRCLMLD